MRPCVRIVSSYSVFSGVRPREASGKKAGAGRAGLSEDPNFAAGYEAIFGKKGQAPTPLAPELPLKAPRDRFEYPKHPDSKPFSPDVEPGDYVFVRDRNGVVHVVKETEGHLHPKILGGGEPASGAGGIKVGDGGKILEIDNASGTFRFEPDVLEQVKEALRQQGANVDAAILRPFEN